MFAIGPTISVRDIRDGTSSTIVLGESSDSLHGIWIGHKNFMDQCAPINARYGSTGPWECCMVPRGSPMIGRLGCDFGQEFHSHHPSGANFLFADGSAKFLREQIEPRVLAALLSRKGGEIISSDAY